MTDQEVDQPQGSGVESGGRAAVVVWAGVALVGLLMVLWVTMSNQANERSAVDEPRFELTASEVVMEVTGVGTETADLTIGLGGQTSQQSGLAVPVRNKDGSSGLRFEASPGDTVYLAAQRKESDNGSIRCTITVDGEKVADTTSRGPFVIASCSGRV